MGSARGIKKTFFWTFFSWYKGFRTIEVHIKNSKYNYITDINNNSIQEYNIKPLIKLDIFYILSYDIIFEIGVAYILFYNLFLQH